MVKDPENLYKKIIEEAKRKKNNFLGNLGGFPVCPNCGDSRMWKPISAIVFEIKVVEHGFVVPLWIPVCVECLEQPNTLNEERILRNLENFKEDDRMKVSCAISNFRKGLKLKFPA